MTVGECVWVADLGGLASLVLGRALGRQSLLLHFSLLLAPLLYQHHVHTSHNRLAS